MRLEYQLQFPIGKMVIRIGIYEPVQCNSLLDRHGQIELFLPFYKITDHVAGKYAVIIE